VGVLKGQIWTWPVPERKKKAPKNKDWKRWPFRSKGKESERTSFAPCKDQAAPRAGRGRGNSHCLGKGEFSFTSKKVGSLVGTIKIPLEGKPVGEEGPQEGGPVPLLKGEELKKTSG